MRIGARRGRAGLVVAVATLLAVLPSLSQSHASAASSGYSAAVMTDTPVAYWRLGDAPGSTSAADASGHGLTGTYSGGVTLGTAGALTNDTDTAAAFDGSTGRMAVTDTPALRLNGAFSIEFWAKAISFANTYPGILVKGYDWTADGYGIWYSSDGSMHLLRNNVGVDSGPGLITTDKYHHVVVTYDGTNVRWYGDGVLSTTTAMTYPTNNGTNLFKVGLADKYGADAVDELALYDHALAADRISAHFQAASTPAGATVPAAPTNVVAKAGGASATVTWTAPADGGSPITSYTVTAAPGGATATVGGSTTSAVVASLTNGTSYTFTVTATNAVGTGPASAASNAVTPTASPPGAPTAVTAKPANMAATVSWTAPSSDGGSAITSYTVTASPGGKTVVVPAPTTTASVTGLTNGTSYTFTVQASNTVGTGPASAPSNAVVPATLPGAPTAAKATAGVTSATVSWTAPASNGGSAILSYTITSSPGAVTATVTAPATSGTVVGLTAGTSYTFTVQATNAIGTGPASAASNAVTPTASATTTPTTYRDFKYNTKVTAPPSADKPQSKLWYNAGSWWGLLATSGDGSTHIFELMSSTHTWRDTGVRVDARVDGTGDALWDGTRLYVATRSYSANPQLMRFTYNVSQRTYTADAGFPAKIANGGSESITLAKDSTGHLWATYTQSSKVWVTHSSTSDAAWVAAFVPPVAETSVSSDDISDIVSFKGKIGVMWSNQVTQKMRFVTHTDGANDSTWGPLELAYGGTEGADDHINIKVDSTGRLWVAAKTSQGDSPGDSGSAPLVNLLVRNTDGTWKSTVFGTVDDDHTRGVVALDEVHQRVYLFATAPVTGGTIYYKSTSMSAPSFPSGTGAPFVTWSGAVINNATIGKGSVNGTTGIVVLACDTAAYTYYHAEMALPA